MIEHYLNLVKEYGKNDILNAKWIYGMVIIDSAGKEHIYTWSKDNIYFVNKESKIVNKRRIKRDNR